MSKRLHEHQRIIADQLHKATRLDHYLSISLKNKSRNQIQSYIREGKITVNGQRTKSSYTVKGKDVIVLYEAFELEKELRSLEVSLDIRYESPELIVINKPAGMPMHEGLSNFGNSLLNALKAHYKLTGQQHCLLENALVHRIDKDTSGLVVVAKTKQAHELLSKQFLEKKPVRREYTALVWGAMKKQQGTIEKFIGRNPKNPFSIEISKDRKFGKYACTHFDTLQSNGRISLVKCVLETGRTHQIRVHMQSIGHPLVGDRRYNLPRHNNETLPETIEHHMLHAKTLEFTEPGTGALLQFESSLPGAYSGLLDTFK
ncbi:MAG: RluA family pseudouridine synthase [Cytophagales bacterium]|nr:RluA family pseudouridine synthase [Cytophagales bacterium]